MSNARYDIAELVILLVYRSLVIRINNAIFMLQCEKVIEQPRHSGVISYLSNQDSYK